nr:MAG TPA: hypothetical protein [Caudoviricetes sp.]DAM12996.1 MAG TPA: hypothetical protein [Caudoviricetes sp.]
MVNVYFYIATIFLNFFHFFSSFLSQYFIQFSV